MFLGLDIDAFLSYIALSIFFFNRHLNFLLYYVVIDSIEFKVHVDDLKLK